LTLRAWVTAPDGVDEAALRAWLAARLPDALVPGAFVVVAALPRTASGKLDRAALPALEPVAAADAAQADTAAPRTDTERRLAAIWSAVLGRDRIGVDDNFFRIGGHSLLVMSMMSRVRREFGDALVLRHFFAGPTLAAFARQIDTLGATPGADALEIGEL
jgi:enterobactin synthetase component F